MRLFKFIKILPQNVKSLGIQKKKLFNSLSEENTVTNMSHKKFDVLGICVSDYKDLWHFIS